MHMPEAAIDKNDSVVFWQDNIGLSRIAFVIFAVTETVAE